MFKSLNFKVILFGFIFTFFSSFGQSFFLGLFNSSIRDALSITHGQFGSIYASATLLSSFILVWLGKKIDDFNILKFASYVIALLVISCFLFSKISSVPCRPCGPAVWIYCPCLFLSNAGLCELSA